MLGIIESSSQSHRSTQGSEATDPCYFLLSNCVSLCFISVKTDSIFYFTCGQKRLWLINPQSCKALKALNPCQGYVWLIWHQAGRSEVTLPLRGRMRSLRTGNHVNLWNSHISIYCIHITLTWASRSCFSCKPRRPWPPCEKSCW